MHVNIALLDAAPSALNNKPMVERTDAETTEGFGKRFEELRAGMSYQALSDAIQRKTGIRISAQAMHKWSKGGGIDPKQVQLLAKFWGVSAAWLAYGVGSPTAAPTLDDAVKALPEDAQLQVLDYIRYKIERASALMAEENRAKYVSLLESMKLPPKPGPSDGKKKPTGGSH
jgi:hypothetical protein